MNTLSRTENGRYKICISHYQAAIVPAVFTRITEINFNAQKYRKNFCFAFNIYHSLKGGIKNEKP
jgi:hypothetical protein